MGDSVSMDGDGVTFRAIDIRHVRSFELRFSDKIIRDEFVTPSTFISISNLSLKISTWSRSVCASALPTLPDAPTMPMLRMQDDSQKAECTACSATADSFFRTTADMLRSSQP